MKPNRYRTFLRFRPGDKDIGHRFSDEEFAQEFLEPIQTSIGKERTPYRHCRENHENHKPQKE